MLCPYRHIFGKEREGVHAMRLLDFAIVDVALTVVGAYLIAQYFSISFPITLLCAFSAGIIMHRLFCVNTKLNTIIFGFIQPPKVC